MEQKDYERLAKLEAQLENLTQLMIEMKAQLSSFTQNFPTRLEVNEMFRSRDQDIQETREEVKELRNDNKARSAQIAAWAGVVVAILALFISYFK